jgi:hypothetical protein
MSRTERPQHLVTELRAEKEILALALTFPEKISLVPFLRAHHFLDSRYGRFFEALRTLHSRGIDTQSMALLVREISHCEDIAPEHANEQWIAQLLALDGVGSDIIALAEIIIDEYNKRQLAAVANNLLRDANNGRALSEIRDTYQAALHEIFSAPDKLRQSSLVTFANEVVYEHIEWLWPDRIPLSQITLFAGRPGSGKSSILMDVASRVSTGTPWPDDTPCERGGVLVMSAEDTHSRWCARLRATYADQTRIAFLNDVIEQSNTHQRILLRDVALIDQAIDMVPDCRLLIIDPITAYIEGKLDINKDNEVRDRLQPIAEIARRRKLAVCVIAHHRKASDSYADSLVMGSTAFVGLARIVWHVCRDPDDRSRILMLPGKCNIIEQPTGLAARIIGDPARMHWEHEPVRMHADDLMERRGRKPAVRSFAEEWLAERLSRGPVPVSDITREWHTQHRGSESTLQRARQNLRVETLRVEGQWCWQLPQTCVDCDF